MKQRSVQPKEDIALIKICLLCSIRALTPWDCLFARKNIDDTILSESLKQRFRCEDLLEQLISSKADDENMTGEAELFGMRVPGLSVTLDWVYARDDDDPEQVEKLTWNTGTDLLIDFNKSSEDQPVTYQLINDPQWALTLDMNKDEAPEAYAKMVKEALEARPKIPLSDDDEHIFQTEPYKNPEPTINEGQTTDRETLGAEPNKNAKKDGV